MNLTEVDPIPKSTRAKISAFLFYPRIKQTKQNLGPIGASEKQTSLNSKNNLCSCFGAEKDREKPLIDEYLKKSLKTQAEQFDQATSNNPEHVKRRKIARYLRTVPSRG